MAALNEAYRVLSDPQARLRYDKTVDIPRSTARKHYDNNHEYVYTPHTRQHATTSARPRPQSSRSRTWTPPKKKASPVSKWAWAATFAVLIGCLLGAAMQNPIPEGAASAVSGSGTNSSNTQSVPDVNQQTAPTPSNTLNDTPPTSSSTYTDPTARESSPNTSNSSNNSTGTANQQACAQYHKYPKRYEDCMGNTSNCNSTSYYDYLSC